MARAVRGRRLRRYLQIVPVAIVLWALDALDRFRGGAQAAGLRHAPVIVAVSRHLGERLTMVMNHWLAAHPVAAAAAVGYYILLHGLVTGIAGICSFAAATRPSGCTATPSSRPAPSA